MLDSEETIHPRPQMTRPRWIDLSGPWGFAYDDHDRGIEERWQEREDIFTRTITVPFPPESAASGIDDNSYHPVVWYRRTVRVPFEDAGKRLLLHFGAVDYCAQVWVNGRLVATHEGGHTPFSVDITTALGPDGEGEIVVRAEDMPNDLAQPRGKQDWRERPHSIWYKRTTGIWQPVWLEPVSDTYFTGIRWTPNLERAVLGMGATIRRRTDAPLRVRLRLSLHGVQLVDDVYTVHGSAIQRDIVLDLGDMTMSRGEVLWAPATPNLIDATLTLFTDEGIIDEVQSYVGLRSVGFAEGRFLLNGQPYYLRLALEQGYWPESNLAAPNDAAIRREVELAKELGFNGVRIHQKVEDPRFLYWCDRLGLLVWGEMANAYVFSVDSAERLTREWLEVLNRDYSHPCIIVWVPLNESWGVPNLLADPAQQHYVRSLYHLTKALDPTRPVIGNDGWEYLVGDVFGIHDYAFSGDTLRQRYGSTEALERTLSEVQPSYRFVSLQGSRPRGEPIMITEFGGISYQPATGTPWYCYGTVTDKEEFLEKYRELVDAVLDCPTIAGFCYTQLTDTDQETNGLLTAERQFKLDPGAVRTINTRPSVAVPGDVITQLRRVAGTPFGSSSAGPEAWAPEDGVPNVELASQQDRTGVV